MKPEEIIAFIAAVHGDPALGPVDKSVASRIYISMDSMGECRLSRKAIAKLEGLSPKSVRRALSRLFDAGWLVKIRVTDYACTYRCGPRITQGTRKGAPESPGGQKFPPKGVKISPPPEEKTESRRIEMRRDQVERIIAAMTDLQRLYDAGASTEMTAVTEEQKRLWLIYSEQLQEDIDTLVKHLAGYPQKEN
ncbi:MAG: hypothetical protein AB1426_13125 [Bacillota bacterium]